MAIPSKPVRKSNGATVELLEWASTTADADLDELTGAHRTSGYAASGEKPSRKEWSYYRKRVSAWLARLSRVGLFTDTVASHDVCRADDADANGRGLLCGSTTTEDQASGTTGDARLYFLPDKQGAFRAGQCTGSRWNTGGSNVGDGSAGFGKDSLAPGAQSLAGGDTCWADGAQSVALGKSAKAEGVCALAVGDTAWAQAPGAVALGNHAQAAENGVALGHTATAGTSALAAGTNATASDGCVAVGDTATAEGVQSAAFGASSEAFADGSLAAGQGNTVDAGASGSLAVGKGLHVGATSTDLVALGTGTGTAIGGAVKGVMAGFQALLNAAGSIAIGWLAKVYGERGIAIGKGAQVGSGSGDKTGGIAIGPNAWASESGGIAIGSNAQNAGAALGDTVIADAPGAFASGAPRSTFGVHEVTRAGGEGSRAHGRACLADGDFSYATGEGARVRTQQRGERAHSVALMADQEQGACQYGDLGGVAELTGATTRKLAPDNGGGVFWTPPGSDAHMCRLRVVARIASPEGLGATAHAAFWAVEFATIKTTGPNGAVLSLHGGVTDGVAITPYFETSAGRYTLTPQVSGDGHSLELVGAGTVGGEVVRFSAELDYVTAGHYF